NGIDDDHDGLTDCYDDDCYSYAKCNGTSATDSDDGCGCRSAGSHTSTSFSLLLFVAMLAFVYRRKMA
ncbi:hypothetical protein KJ865_10215, partial [Myxococcota bacterium]|nr:hypothetical protein [Myxococcota bacterium]